LGASRRPSNSDRRRYECSIRNDEADACHQGDWLDELVACLTVISVGKRRMALQKAIETMFEVKFAGRIFNFDQEPAGAFGEISANRRKFGRPIGIMDAQIAAIARSQGTAIATRDISDFEDCGVELIDPWA
jgi:toxin FitB